jgi:hypothetical protein
MKDGAPVDKKLEALSLRPEEATIKRTATTLPTVKIG